MLRLLASGFGLAATVSTSVLALACLLLLPLDAFAAGTISEQIIVDQFGWRADAPRKVVIFSDPIDGQNSAVSYTPGASFQLRRVSDEAIIFTGATVAWNGGATDATSGDKVWHGDFSSVTTPGEYYIYDPANDLRSFAFKLDNAVFNDVLKASIRMYYYQRTGTSIPVQHAGNWSRGPTHLGPGEDSEALLWVGDAAVPGTQRDVSGGWFDAGDFNKYAPWASGLLWDLLASYEWNPVAFGDNSNIPESGNGVPDALDEFKWCLDWLLKMQLPSGSVLNRVGDGPGGRYYTPATTWSTSSFAAAMAHASRVYAPYDSVYPGYSTTLLAAATNAWNYLSVTPDMTPSSGSDGANGIAVASAGSNPDEDFRLRVLAAAELWKTTGNATYKTYFEANYNAPGSYSGPSHPLYGGWPHFDPTGFMELNRAFVTYAMTPGANPTIIALIKSSLYNMTSSIAWNYNNGSDPYRSYMWDYFWGSNGVKSQWANLLTFAIKLNVGTAAERTQYREIAEEYVHYIHGRNPLSQVYLSNMGTKGANIGGDKSAMEIWHGAFFGAQFDGVNSTYGPAPGFLVGGPNRYYTVTTVSPPYGQPPSKSYKDWNTGWPESSWEITEPSIGYQSGYCLMLSQFAVTPDTSPGNLAAAAVSSSQINLTWEDNASNEDSFELQRATNASFSSGLVTTTLGSNVTSASVTGLTVGTTYYFRVRAIISSVASGYSNTASATPNNSRAIYAFEGSAQDSSGSGNHGTATALSYVAGKVGAQAAQFNGSGASVTIPPSVTDDFTVTMWVKTTDSAGAAGAQWWAGKGLVDGEIGGGGADWGTSIVNGKFVLGVGAGGGDITVASSVNINDDTWHHLAATRNNTSGAMQVYVDGVLRGSGTGPTGSRTWPTILRIGGLQPGSNYLNGTLDEVRLYDSILTVEEIAESSGLPPVAPIGFAATPGSGGIALSWTASALATEYHVKRSTTPGSGHTTIATVTGPSFTDTTVSDGTTYYYVITAENGVGESGNSAEIATRTDALILHLKLDETSGTTAADTSGFDRDAALVNSPAFAAGRLDNALAFTGASSQHATLPTGLVSSLNDFTISAWVKPTTLETWARVFDFGSGTGTNMFFTTKNGNNDRPRFGIKIGGSAEQQIDAPNALVTGVWTHIAITLSGNTGNLYIDGVASGSNTITFKPSGMGNTTQNYLGRSQWPDPYLNGALDDFRIYSRALTSGEVQILAAGQLAAPQTPVASPGNGQISLTWNSVPGATGYIVRRSANSGGSYSDLASGVAATSYTDTGLAIGATWHYTIVATGLPGIGLTSSSVSATTYTAVEIWRLANFGTTANTGNTANNADPDGDGWTNQQEFISGTDPNSRSSLLKFDSMQAGGNNMNLTFPSVLGRTYRVERSASMLDGEWIAIQDNIPGTGSSIQVTDIGGSGHEKRFYRIVAGW